MSRLLFPLWQIDEPEYGAVCAHLGLTPKPHLRDRLNGYLASAPFCFARPAGFSHFLATLRLTRFRIARLDVVTKLLYPDHPVRHALNGVIALHECDGAGYREMAASPAGWKAVVLMVAWLVGFGLRAGVTVPWLVWQFFVYVVGIPFRATIHLTKRRVLITGVNRGLGLDLMLRCLEQGAEVIGTVRDRQALTELRSWLPGTAPVKLLVAELSQPGNLVRALHDAQVPADSLHLSILCAGVKHDGASALSLDALRETFQVNFFAAAEFAAWLCAFERTSVLARSAEVPDPSGSPVRESAADSRALGQGQRGPRALVLISSMGRWHGMHYASGYNASKAALSIWGESLDMELCYSQTPPLTVTVVEPGMFASGMSRQTPLTRFLFVPRRDVAVRILSGALAGRKTIRPPYWFALLTWGVCLAGRNVRLRLFARAKPAAEH